jgi:glycosyltransferase involved in cell wall biosynthesis
MTPKMLLMIGNYLSTQKWNKNVWHYLSERLAEIGWDVITTSSKENRILRMMDMLWTIWRERKNTALAQIDVFSGRAFIFAEVSAWHLSHLNKPILLTLHGGKLPEFSQQYPQRVQRLLSQAQVVVTPSHFIKSALSNFRTDIRLIPNPIDLSKAKLRQREKAKPKLIWVRAFHEVYNPSLAPRVIKLLASEFPEVHLMMLGPDKGDGSLAHMLDVAKNLSVADKIEVVGSVPHLEIPQWLDKADIFINTTNYDAAPRSVLEAMANGLCVVSTNVGGIPTMIDDGTECLLVPPDDPIAMANATKKILNNPKLAERLSINAHQKALDYDWSNVLPKWDELLHEIINKSYV